MNLGSLFKATQGGGAADVLAGVLSAMGVKVEMQELNVAEASGSLREVAIAAGARGASLYRVKGKLKSGEAFDAFIVSRPLSQTRVTVDTSKQLAIG